MSLRVWSVRSVGKRSISLAVFAGLAVSPSLVACGDDITNHYWHYGAAGAEPQLGEAGSPAVAPSEGGAAGFTEPGEAGMAGLGESKPEGGAGGAQGEAGSGGDDSGVDPRYPEAPLVDTAPADFTLDIFGTMGNRYWFGVSEEQRVLMNEERSGGQGNGDIYQPRPGEVAAFVDHLWVTTAGDEAQTVDYGKVQVKVVGGSTWRRWDDANIPNLNIDADEFVENQRIGGYEHLRFSNGQMGTIFRDHFAYRLYAALDYPAPLTTYAWVSSNVWGPEVAIPYTLVERYKRRFCERHAEQFGGGCANMWEYWGDFAGSQLAGPEPSRFDDANNCQIGDCDNTRVKRLEETLAATPYTEGFKAALAEYIDWPAFHRFQCLSWVLATSDDAIHAGNNVVLVERDDGLFQYLPYSVDISMGLWENFGSLQGSNALASGCQNDPQCWTDTLDECEDLIADFKAIDPQGMLEAVYDTLDEEGMLRQGDWARYVQLDDWLSRRLASLSGELEEYRNGSLCHYPEVDCGGYCEYMYCQDQCIPPGMGQPLPVAPGNEALMDPGAGGGMGVGGAAAVGGGMGMAGSGQAGGSGPVICPTPEMYQLP